MLELGAPIHGAVYINAALKRDIEVPESLRWMHVYYNQYDEVVPLASLPVVGKLLFDPRWGNMGRDGYTGTDPRVKQYDCWNQDALPLLSGHSAFFREDGYVWGQIVGTRIKEALDV
jgi:hypothetical protein